MAISYKRDTDYQKKINQAAAIGDNTAAAVYEAQRNRSEERRVGKECSEPCRSRWSPYH